MIVARSTFLPGSFERCLEQVVTTRLLRYVAWPLVTFVPVSPPVLPERWEEGKYVVGLRLFGFIPLGRQTIDISVPSRSGSHIVLRDNGYSSLISRWDHLITIRSAQGGCVYTDRVEIKAGVLTPIVWAFTWFFYRHRQRRWQQLVRQEFEYRRT